MLLPGALAVVAGLLWAGSHPPVGAWPLSFLVVGVQGAALLLATEGRTGWSLVRRAFAVGLIGGWVAFLAIIAWAANITPGGMAAWPLLSLIEAIYLGVLAVVLAPWLRHRWVGGAALALGHVGMEVLRGAWPAGGFGWGELGYAHVGGSWLVPMARIGGVHLVTLVVAIVGALLFEAWRQTRDELRGLEGSPADFVFASLPHGQRALTAMAGVLLLSLVATIEPPAPTGAADVLVVQGNDQERPKVLGRDLDRIIADQHLALTRAAIADGPVPDVVVWPESSVDRDVFSGDDDVILATVRAGADLADGGLLAGVRWDGPEPRTFLNTVVWVTDDGAAAARYVKRDLVPFGEYLPLRRWLDGIGPLAAVGSDGVRGTEPTHLFPAGRGTPVRTAVMICFETLFQSTVRDNVLGPDGEPARLLVAATNDASFGRGAEPPQHLAQSRMRAIETGRWVVHAAISGQSAFVDPEGRVHDLTDLFTATTIRREVPLVDGMTPFLRTGDVAGRLGLVALFLLAMLAPVALRRSEGPALDVPADAPADAALPTA